MITTYLPNNIPRQAGKGGIGLLFADPIIAPSELPTNDICYCAYQCPYIELAFADLSDNSEYKNDTSSFLFDRVTGAGIVNFELYKDGAKVADLNDNTLGTLYDSFEEKIFYKGFKVEWSKVAQLFGFGEYQFKANQTILGVNAVFESRYFRLLPYSDFAADNTVKIVGVQNGNIVSSPLDYTNLLDSGWKEAYRIKGIFGFKEHELIKDTYEDSFYNQRQIRDEVKRTYTLETRLLPSAIANWLSESASLANYLEVTDYNINNTEIFRDVKVKADSFESIETYLNKRSLRYTIKLTDFKQDLIKRNF